MALLAGLTTLLAAGSARAQTPASSRRLSAIQQQNAVLQQRNAVQTAALQTTILLQGSYRQNTVTSAINFQLEQNAMRDAIQQTSTLQRAGVTSSNAAAQLNALLSASQQVSALQAALQSQNGALTSMQLQQLSQVQGNLLRLLLSQSPPPAKRTPGR
jgi:hypothetical protein